MGLLDSIFGGTPQEQPTITPPTATPDNAATAFNFFVGQGLAPHQAAGIVGNLMGESGQGLNPNATNKGDGRDGSDSIGIGQWNSDRAAALKAYAESKGKSWNDLNTQLEFLHSELQGPERKAYAALQAAKTPEEAGRAFLAYERPKDWNVAGSHPERSRYAVQAFNAYGGGQPQPAPVTPAAPSGGLLTTPSAGLLAAPPSFPQAPQAAPQQQADQGGDIFSQMQPPQQAQPIFFAPRRAADLSKLRAAFKPPVFSRG